MPGSLVLLNGHVTTPDVGFVPTVMALRPPRVAIVFPSDDHWRDWVMEALSIASGYWGGAGFVLVPFDPSTSEPASAFKEVVRAYDPDHVVTLEVPLAKFEEWYPGLIQIEGVDSSVERRSLIESANLDTDHGGSPWARDVVASWCSPMRGMRLLPEDGERPPEERTSIKRADPEELYPDDLVPAPVPQTASRLAATPTWRSDIGLLAAMRLGVALSDIHDRPEPDATSLGWLLRPRGDAPPGLIWTSGQSPVPSSAGLLPWFLEEQHLQQMASGFRRETLVLVVGDSAEDFALALAYDRVLGRAIWLTPLVLESELFDKQVQPGLSQEITEAERNAKRVVLTSSSASRDYLVGLSQRVQSPRAEVRINGRARASRRREALEVRDPNLSRGTTSYFLDEHIGFSATVPVSKHVDGSMEALVGLESPVPARLIFDEHSGKVPYWYVDATIAGDAAPRGRDFPNGALTVSRGGMPEILVRASKDGFTFNPRSMGLVLSGTLLSGRIDKPILRSQSMRSWVESMAAADGLGVRMSAPGRHAELLRRRVGTRRDLLDLVSGTNVPMLRAFVQREKAIQPSERHPDIVVLGVDPYLSFEAIQDLLKVNDSNAMAIIDGLISTSLLRRGLILDCIECGRPSFVSAERLGQRFECPQCTATNDLVADRWKRSSKEPRWFYDLYAVFRELLGSHGDVVLLAAAELDRQSRVYDDTPELEFFDLKTGHAVAEIDVIASVDRDVVLVEAKSNGTFGPKKRGSQTQKLLRVASALRADRIILATTKNDWNAEDVRHLTAEGLKATPFSVDVQTITNLGAPAPAPAVAVPVAEGGGVTL